MKGLPRIVFIAAVVFLAGTFVYGENVRGRLAAVRDVTSSSPAEFPLDSLVSIRLENPEDFLQAVEIEISIPPQVRRFRDSFSLSLYKNVTPEPDKTATSYFADQVTSLLLPSSTKFYLQVPVKEDHTLKAVQGTTIVNEHVEAAEFPIVLSILPVMKGIPSYVYESRFSIKLKPIYFSRGKAQITLEVENSDEEVESDTMRLLIDEREVTYPRPEYILPVGIHTLSVVSSRYKDVSLQFGVEEGKTNTLTIALEPEQSYIRFEAPEQATIFIDGTRYNGASGKRSEITTGVHTVLFKLGEYSISKKIEIKPGKNYNISLFFDIFINED